MNSAEVKEYSKSLGLDLVGIARAEVFSAYRARMRTVVSETSAAQPDYMISPVKFPRNDNPDEWLFDKLVNPSNVMENPRSVVIVGVYAYDDEGTASLPGLRGRTAVIYRYYPVVHELSRRLAEFIRGLGFEAVEGQHVPLKYVAVKAGLGCYGKNAILLTERFASFVALRSIVTDAELEPDGPFEHDLCGSCEACLKACPTGALYAPRKLNPKLCINPITRREQYIPPEMRPKIRNNLSGCNVCQEVCPHAKKLTPRRKHPLARFDSTSHGSHAHLDGFDPQPELMPLLDPSRPFLLRRNTAIILGNLGDPAALPHLRAALRDASEPLAQYIRWAIEQILSNCL